MTHKKKGKFPFKKKGAVPAMDRADDAGLSRASAPARRSDHGSGALIRKAYAKRGGK